MFGANKKTGRLGLDEDGNVRRDDLVKIFSFCPCSCPSAPLPALKTPMLQELLKRQRGHRAAHLLGNGTARSVPTPLLPGRHPFAMLR